MPPKTKAETNKTLLGQPDSVLKSDFIQSVLENKNDDILPFSGSLQLPTTEEVLKLFYFYRDHFGHKNSHVSQEDIFCKVSAHVIKYWSMSGFQTMSLISVRKKI